jgi:hypothetical protein
MARTLTLKHVPEALVEAIVDMALNEDRTPTAQAERLLREALARHGRWPQGDQQGPSVDGNSVQTIATVEA